MNLPDENTSLRVLVIEDEKKLASVIAASLDSLGYRVTIAPTGEDGFYLASTGQHDLVLLDLNLPGRDGIEILAGLRRSGWKTPVLILTARDGLDARVQGLDAGADDYLVKPFAFPELHARIRALTRRSRNVESTKLRCADLVLDRVGRTVARAGQSIDLTTREYEILEYLMRFPGQVVSRELIAREIWGEKSRVVPLDNVIDVHVARLRAKVDAPFDAPLIKTRRGLGFVIESGEHDNAD